MTDQHDILHLHNTVLRIISLSSELVVSNGRQQAGGPSVGDGESTPALCHLLGDLQEQVSCQLLHARILLHLSVGVVEGEYLLKLRNRAEILRCIVIKVITMKIRCRVKGFKPVGLGSPSG